MTKTNFNAYERYRAARHVAQRIGREGGYVVLLTGSAVTTGFSLMIDLFDRDGVGRRKKATEVFKAVRALADREVKGPFSCLPRRRYFRFGK